MISGLPRRVNWHGNRHAIHYRYIELQRMSPEDFPPEPSSPVTWNDVPGCQGSGSWRNAEQYANMINCTCPTREAWNRG